MNFFSGKIIQAAMKVHSVLGPGLLERTYEACLCYELQKQNMRVETQVEVPVMYGKIKIDLGYRIDLLVEESIIVELKTVKELAPIHEAQLLSYLKMSGLQLGLLINFNVVSLKSGIHRIVNRF